MWAWITNNTEERDTVDFQDFGPFTEKAKRWNKITWSSTYFDTHSWDGQGQHIPLCDQVSSDQGARDSVPDLDLSCRISTDDGVIGEEGDAPDHHLSALGCSDTSLHQQPVCGVAWMQQKRTRD